MAKSKKEFKRRVEKMKKHVTACLELAPSDEQRETLYEVEGKLNWLTETADAWFDPERNAPVEQDRKDPRSVAN
jgi:hypothetical protein